MRPSNGGGRELLQLSGYGRSPLFRFIVYLLTVLLSLQIWPVSVVQAEDQQPGSGTVLEELQQPEPDEDVPGSQPVQPAPEEPAGSESVDREPESMEPEDEGFSILQDGEVLPPRLSRLSDSPTTNGKIEIQVQGLNGEGEQVTVFVAVDGGEPQLITSEPIVIGGSPWESVTYTAPGDGTYEFTAVTNWEGVDSEPSEPVTVIVDTTPPPAPQLQGWAVNDEIIVVVWDPPADDVVHYEVYQNDQMLSKYKFDINKELFWDATPNFVHAALQPETTYEYTVIAYDHVGHASEMSASLEVTTGPVPPRFNFKLASSNQEGEPAHERSDWPAVSGDGKYLAFTSWSDNLVEGATNFRQQVYLKNLATGEVIRLSESADGSPADNDSSTPAITPDGRFVVFETRATNLDPDHTGTIFLWDHEAWEAGSDALERVDLPNEGQPVGRYWAWSPSVSDDGKRIAFIANTEELAPLDDPKNKIQAYVRDRQEKTTRLVSILPSGKQPESVREVAISGDGRFVAFSAVDLELDVPYPGLPRVYLVDLEQENPVAEMIGVDYLGRPSEGSAYNPSINADGSLVLLHIEGVEMEDGIHRGGLFLYHRETGKTEYITYRDQGIDLFHRARPFFHELKISADGSKILVNLVWDDDHPSNLYVHDRDTETWSRVVSALDGGKPAWDSYSATISADGSTIAFRYENFLFGGASVPGGPFMPLADGSSGDPLPGLPPGSHILLATFDDQEPPTWPPEAEITATQIGATFINFTWTPARDNVGVSGYQIYVDDELKDTVPGHMTAYTLSNLTPETTYEIRIAAGDAADHWTDGPATAITTAAVAAGEAALAVQLLPGGAAELTWDPADLPDLEGYRLWRRMGDDDAVLVAEVPAGQTGYRDEGLAAGATYSYYVTIVAGGQESPHTITVTVTTGQLALESFRWTGQQYLQNLVLGSSMQFVAQGEPGRQGEVELSYETWFDGDTRLPEPQQATGTIVLEEDAEAPGTYRGEFVIEEGIAAVTGAAAILTDGAGSQVELGADNLPVNVTGAMAVTIDAQGAGPDVFADGILLQVKSPSRQGGGAERFYQPGTITIAPLLPAGDYTIEVLGLAGMELAKADGPEVRRGLTAETVIQPKLPASLQVQVVDPHQEAMSGFALSLVRKADGRPVATLSVPAGPVEPGDDLWSPMLKGLVAGDELQATITGAPAPWLLGTSKDIVLAPGLNQEVVQAKSPPTGTVKGTVRFKENGQPAQGIHVSAAQIFADGRSHTATAITGESGQYSIEVPIGADESDAEPSVAITLNAASVDGRYLTPETVKVDVQPEADVPQDLELDVIGPGQIEVNLSIQHYGEDLPEPIILDDFLAAYWGLHVKTPVGTYKSQSGGYPLVIRGRPGDLVEVCLRGSLHGFWDECRTEQLDDDRNAVANFDFAASGQVTGRVLYQGRALDPADPVDRMLLSEILWNKNIVIEREDETGRWLSVARHSWHQPDFAIELAEAGHYSLRVSAMRRWQDQSTGADEFDHLASIRHTFTVAAGERIALGDIDLSETIFTADVRTLPGTLAPGGSASVRVGYRGGRGLPHPSHNANHALAVEFQMVIDLPAGVELIDGTVAHSGKPLGTGEYTVQGGSLIVPLQQRPPGGHSWETHERGYEGTVTFQVRVDEDAANDFLTMAVAMEGTLEDFILVQPFQYIGAGLSRAFSQPLAAAQLTVSGVVLTAPGMMFTPETTLRGRAPAGSLVQVYDDQILLGETTANSIGSWQLPVTLADRGEPSWHLLQARAEHNGARFDSDSVPVWYDPDSAELMFKWIKVQITRSGNPTGPVRTFYPSVDNVEVFTVVYTSELGYIIEAYFNRPDLVTDVVVRTGIRSTVAQRTQDEDGEEFFRAVLLPGTVVLGDITIEYSTERSLEDLLSKQWEEDDLRRRLPPHLQGFEVQGEEGDAADGQFQMVFPEIPGASFKVGVRVEDEDYTPSPEEEAFAAETGLPVYGLELVEHEHPDGNYGITLTAYLPQEILAVSGQEEIAGLLMAALSGGLPDGQTVLAMPIQPMQATGFAKAAIEILSSPSGKAALKGLKGAPLSIWGANSTRVSIEGLMEIMDKVLEVCTAEAAQGYVDKLRSIANSMMAAEVTGWFLSLAGLVLAAPTGGAAAAITMGAGAAISYAAWLKHETQLFTLLLSIKNDPECNLDEDEEELTDRKRKPASAGNISPQYLIDPSGYVFEAVPENRLEGVTASVWYLEPDPGGGGSPDEPGPGQWHLWDAHNYEQENPQVTDAAGRYGWDVLQGWWQVMYEKDGYETGYSDVLPVPPPHFDVNVGLVSYEPPQVEGVSVAAVLTPDGESAGDDLEDPAVTVTFSKYVAAADLTGDAIVVTTGGGERLQGTVEPVAPAPDPADGGDEPRLLAKAGRFVPDPDAPFFIGEEYTLWVGGSIESYAGVLMGSDYEETFTAVRAPVRPSDDDDGGGVPGCPTVTGGRSVPGCPEDQPPGSAGQGPGGSSSDGGAGLAIQVGEEGGTFSDSDEGITIQLPPGTFAAGTRFTAQPAGDEEGAAVDAALAALVGQRTWRRVSRIYTLDAGGASPHRPMTLTLRYDPQRLSNIDPRLLGVYRQDPAAPGGWRFMGGVVDPQAGTVTVVIDELGTFTVMALRRTFTDLAGHWARTDVEILAAREIVDGIGGGLFDPGRPVTRAEFVKLLVAMLEQDADFRARISTGASDSGSASGAPSFSDVSANAWYYLYVEGAAALGLVVGDNGAFRPNDPITREEMAVMVIRALNMAEEAGGAGGSGLASGTLEFTDAGQIAGWARAQVALAVARGLLLGMDDGSFAPQDDTTRAQAAAVVRRALEWLGILPTP